MNQREKIEGKSPEEILAITIKFPHCGNACTASD